MLFVIFSIFDKEGGVSTPVRKKMRAVAWFLVELGTTPLVCAPNASYGYAKRGGRACSPIAVVVR